MVSSREFPSSGPLCSIRWLAMNRSAMSVPQYDASWRNGSINHPRARAITEDFCLTGVGQNADLVLNLALSALSGDTPKRAQHAEELLRLVRHRPVALLLAADRIKDLVEARPPGIGFQSPLSS